MPASNRKLSIDDIGILFLISALIFGAWFRIFVPYTAGFPINDGGLFYKMIEGVHANHYHLPEYIRYNGLDIPFAYPPLAFYFAGLVSDLCNITLINALRWIPAVTLIAVIPTFYYFAKLILQSRFEAGLASLLYALTPGAITWQIMGGGITRGLGQLFLLLAISNIFLLFTEKQKKHLVLSIIFSSLVCLTHPEATIHTIGSALLICAFYGRNKEGIIHMLFVSIGTLCLTAPWWVTVLHRFGLDPYLSATQTGLYGLNYLIALFVPFSGEPFLTIIALLAILGTATKIAKKEYFIPFWFLLPFIIEPRSAANVSIISMGILASIALTELVFPSLSAFEGNIRNRELNGFLQSRAEKLLFYYLLGCLLISMQYYCLNLSENRVSKGVTESFEWLSLHTPAESRFLILTGKTDVFADFINEWFPVMTNRVSQTTIQGYEWMGDGLFERRLPVMQRIQRCPSSTSALTCIESAATGGFDYDFIFVARKNGSAIFGDNLIAELNNSQHYELAYQTVDAVVFMSLK